MKVMKVSVDTIVKGDRDVSGALEVQCSSPDFANKCYMTWPHSHIHL